MSYGIPAVKHDGTIIRALYRGAPSYSYAEHEDPTPTLENPRDWLGFRELDVVKRDLVLFEVIVFGSRRIFYAPAEFGIDCLWHVRANTELASELGVV